MTNPYSRDVEAWTIISMLRWATAYFGRYGIDSPRATAEILLAHALGLSRIDLYVKHDLPLRPDELQRFRDLIKRRHRREPVAYIVGEKQFWGLDLAVDPSVLIPRPETEHLVEAALAHLPKDGEGPRQWVLDAGTGSGAIVLALAHERTRHVFIGVDRSPAAVAIAGKNARIHGLGDRVAFLAADWFSAFGGKSGRFDLLVSNPPYIRSAALASLQPEIRGYEPRAALDGGADGLDAYRVLLPAARQLVRAGGTLLMEIGCDQRAGIEALAGRLGGVSFVRCIHDYAGLDRVVEFRIA